ncbi:MAG: phosphoglucomutase/phosphomannomutase family protein [Oscillospiraceae bacterium]|nr:phosphoglucomutase/phosphomannomutase family protein [Oscillospiraceae bacterium]
MIQFGTGGWRAIIADGFTKANVQLLAQALADTMNAEQANELALGYDRRFLSREAAMWAAEVLAANGIRVHFINKDAPTPLVMYVVKKRGLPYGMAVTASHNPAVYNGIKLFIKGGRDADENITQAMESRLATMASSQVKVMTFEAALANGQVMVIKPQNEYLDSIIDMIDIDAIRKKNLHVALDPMFGVSRTSLQTLLMTARCDVDTINERRDTLFGGRLPSPNAHTLNDLTNFVKENGCDIGIATDGDADRLGIIDDCGAFVHPNQILVLLYHYLLKYKGWRGAAVRNIATTHLLDRIAAAYGQTCHEVPVGFKHVSGKMAENDAIIGGESSGGLTVRGHIQGKDGIYAAMLLVEMLAVSGRKLSAIYQDITDEFGACYTDERDYSFTASCKDAIYQLLMVDKKLPDFGIEIETVSYIDGCKVYFSNGGWIIARFSGTEPLLRIFSEMPSQAMATSVCDTLCGALGM